LPPSARINSPAPPASGHTIHLTSGAQYYIEGIHHQGRRAEPFAATFKFSGASDPVDGTAPAIAGNLLAVHFLQQHLHHRNHSSSKRRSQPGCVWNLHRQWRSPVILATQRASPPRRFPTSGNPPLSVRPISAASQTPRPVSYTTPVLVSANDGTLFRAALATVWLRHHSPAARLTVGQLKFTTPRPLSAANSCCNGAATLSFRKPRMSTAPGSHPPTKIIRNPSLSAAQSFVRLKQYYQILRLRGQWASHDQQFPQGSFVPSRRNTPFNGHGAAVWI